ncbi:Copper amine oxidase N-terminal domain-containing protein [Desulfonispora thiosulfatigenes DSM 11270]|uniref:Copper amine oxidase N-terminal domain-containing protein n=1 Tax=Desulfonispora thiosulfatigenes DSM 11270 TaxID=656914 RepID=A0A1W1UWD7_DESTI|nr:stalk domain-containing protein [Desulfonispora thiosulfatigenes]SMB85004.1 Copper amine oxidase N-terminal domain-containing protein [Desulfonispora thiosulfatigenes DSM 11270]
MFRFLTILLMTLVMMIPNVSEAAQNGVPQLTEQTPITAGAVLKKYDWQTKPGLAKIHVMEIDLRNPYVQINSISGSGKLTQRLNVSAMAKYTGAIAAINGDFYNTKAEGSPIGPMVMGDRLVTSSSHLQGWYALGITKDRKASIDAFSFDGKVAAPTGAVFKLSGLNKTIYWEEPGGIHSHANKLHLYNDLWGGTTRGNDEHTIPTEMLIKNGVVQAISQDKYFDFAVPEGMYILRGHGDSAKFILDNFKVGDPVDLDYSISPDKNWSMVVGGHALLADNGKAVPYTKDLSSLGGIRARTAAGISQDGNILYLVGVEGRTTNSVGISLKDLASFFEHIGVWKALNLDGGGSTTMVSRPLGDSETQKVFATEQKTERMVISGIGVYSDAPTGTKIQGLKAPEKEQMFLINEEARFSLKAYDEYYNPIDANNFPIIWQEVGNLGNVVENKFIPAKSGKTEISASIDNQSIKFPIKIIGRDDIDQMEVTGTPGANAAGDTKELSITMKTKYGETKKVPAYSVDWEFFNFYGQVSPDGTLTINDTMGNAVGFVVARYEGFSAPFILQFSGNEQGTVPGAGEHKTLELTIGKKTLQAGGANLEMDVAPVIIGGRTLVPVRFISEALGAKVNWEAEANNVTIVKEKNWIDLWPENNFMVVNGKTNSLDVAPKIIEGRTMLPLRAVSESLNLKVEWDEKNQTIKLY